MRRMIVAAVLSMLAAGLSPAAEAAMDKEDVQLETADGVAISGYFVKGSQEKGPAVVLLHMLSRTKEDWDPILEKYLLPKTPFSYLAIDLRGHGKSTSQGEDILDWQDFNDDYYMNMVKDCEAAVKYLRGRDDVDGESIAIVGASIGANVAIITAASDPKIKAVALLSGAMRYKGLRISDALESYGARPVFIAAAREDRPAGNHLTYIRERAKGIKATHGFPGTLHGTRMFGAHALDGPLVEFLLDHLEPVEGLQAPAQEQDP